MKLHKILFGMAVALFSFTSIRFASQDGHWYELFKANIQHVFGEHPAHSVISHLSRTESGGGEGVWLDAIDAKASDDAGGNAIADATDAGFTDGGDFTDVPTVKKFAQADGDFTAYKETLTPFNDVVKYKTYSVPEVNEWGHSFQAAEDTWQNLTDPKSTVISVGMQKMHRRRDVSFARNVIKPAVARRIDGAALANVTLPTTQVVADLEYSEADVDSIPAVIREIMGNAWFTRGLPIYCAVSTALARHLKANSEAAGKASMRSRDFVSSYAQFMSGDLPQVEGVTFIELPKEFMEAVKPVEGAASGNQTDHWFAWSPQAICKVEYQGLGTQIGVDPNRRFYTSAYVSEYVDFKRTDDLGVVVGDIVVP